jgi:uncharacterized lipoprotein YajG
MNMKQIITSNKTILAAALLTLGLTGCALTPATESLNYQAQTGVAHVAHAENVTVNVVTTDSRVDKTIGYKVNGMGMRLSNNATISADEPVDVTVKHAITQELNSRGFHIAQNSNLMIVANIIKFYNEYDVGFASAKANANANILISVSENNHVLFNKNVNGVNTETSYLAASPSLAKTSLEKALANAMTELFNDPAFIAALTTAAPAQAAAN